MSTNKFASSDSAANESVDAEKSILSQLGKISDELSTLKRDRSSYLKSSDVKALYAELNRVAPQILKLPTRSKAVGDKLDDVFQLMSLAFLTVGLKNSAPACYASLITVKRLLDHLGANFGDGQHAATVTFTESDVSAVESRLKEIEGIIQFAKESQESPVIIELLEKKLDICKGGLQQVRTNIGKIDPQLQPVLDKLVYIRREILSIGSSSTVFSPTSFSKILDELRSIESKRVDGRFVDPVSQQPLAEQQRVNSLIDECHDLIDDFSATKDDKLDPSVRPIYKELVELKNSLEGLLITHRWTLRETDLFAYQKKLQNFDNILKEKAKESDGEVHGHSILLYLLRRCYAIIYKLLESSEAISEALQPIHNQLTTARRCLLEVKKMGGLSNARELYPYQMKLASIDNLRVDGKFMVGDTIPEGQGLLNALLNECFDIIYELKVELDERSASSEVNSEDESERDDPE